MAGNSESAEAKGKASLGLNIAAVVLMLITWVGLYLILPVAFVVATQ